MTPQATRFRVFSEDAVKTYACDEPHVVISIRSPSGERAALPKNDLRMDTLWLDFHDVDDTELGQRAARIIHSWGAEKIKPFDEGMARKVREFIEKNAKATTVIVNCEAGISRSSGLAAALSKSLMGDDEEYFKRYVPNTLVYKKVMDEMHKRV